MPNDIEVTKRLQNITTPGQEIVPAPNAPIKAQLVRFNAYLKH